MSNTEDFRKKLLLELFNQLWNSINTRLNLIWQSVSVLTGALAIFALTERNIIPLDIASTIIILITTWFLAHIIDVSFWYNRNLAMIGNIEQQFLTEEDARLLFPYFLTHRRKNKMVYMLKIQASLGIGITLIILFLHFFQSILPNIENKKILTIENVLPYIVLICAIVFLWLTITSRNKQYDDFIKSSPGKHMEETQLGLFQDRD